VFADLRLPNAEENRPRAPGRAINQIIEDLHLSRELLRGGENQPAENFGLSNYRLEGFSVERLMNFLTALDRDVESSSAASRIPKNGPDSVTAA